MDYTKRVTLDINLRGELPVVRVKQNDSYSRFITIQLQKDGVNYTPESDIEILFRCKKPDDHAVLLDSAYMDPDKERYFVILNQDGTISVELTSQVTVVSGRCYCDICLLRNEKILSTIPFMLHVIASPDVSDRLVSTDEFKLVASILEYARELEAGVMQSVCTLTLSANWSGTTSPYTQTVTVSGYSVTANTKVDVCGDASAMAAMEASLTHVIYIQNNNGTLTAYAVGGKPTAAIVLQAGIYETIPI